MLQKFRPDWGFFFPLLAHSALHGIMTWTICWFYNPDMMWLGFVDMAIHFTMDRIKAGPKYLGRYKTITPQEFKASMTYLSWEGHEREKKEARKKLKGNKLFWWSLGLDQMVHHLTDIFTIYVLVTC